MTVPVQTPVTSSIANGVTTVFPFTFKIVDEADLTVTVDGVVVTTGFTITGVGEDGGGDVTFDVAPANGLKVVRYSNPVLRRKVDYQQFGDWLAPIVNGEFDRIWLTLQSLYQALSRSIKLPVDVVAGQDITEDAAERANKVITFDLSGNVALKAGTELIPEVDEAVTNALAAAAAAEASSSTASGFADDAEAAALAASTMPVAAPTHAAASKSTPVEADELPLIDSAESFGLKRLTWANLKATLKTYFDTLYNLVDLVTAAVDTAFTSTADNAAATPAWVRGLALIQNRTVQTTSGAASYDFTIPSGVKRIKLMLDQVSTNGTSQIAVRLGDSGGIVTTGYISIASVIEGSSAGSANNSTAFILENASTAAFTRTGSITLEKITGNKWVTSSSMAVFGAANSRLNNGAGSIELSNELTTIRLTTLNGTDLFDLGAINLSYEF